MVGAQRPVVHDYYIYDCMWMIYKNLNKKKRLKSKDYTLGKEIHFNILNEKKESFASPVSI